MPLNNNALETPIFSITILYILKVRAGEHPLAGIANAYKAWNAKESKVAGQARGQSKSKTLFSRESNQRNLALYYEMGLTGTMWITSGPNTVGLGILDRWISGIYAR